MAEEYDARGEVIEYTDIDIPGGGVLRIPNDLMGELNTAKMVADMRALMDARPPAHSRGLEWVLTNVDNLLAQAATDGNEHRHHDEDISIRVAQVRATQAQALATERVAQHLESLHERLRQTLDYPLQVQVNQR